MNILHNLAQGIVENMKDIINQDINYFDSNGIIIASTDKKRIGDFHGGAKKVLDMKQDLLIRYDGQFKGARQGINLPVYFEKEIVGVIGITGEKDEVEKYGMIIQKMSEILIKEGYIQEQEKIEGERKRKLIEELLFRHYSDDKTLLARAELLNIKTNVNRIVAVTRIVESNYEIALTHEINDEIFEDIKKLIEYNNQNLIVQSGMNIIMIFEIRTKEDIEAIISMIKNDIEKKYRAIVYFGISTPSNDINEIKKSYREAKKTLEVALALKNEEILQYNELDIGLLIDDLQIEVINTYINKVFRGMTRAQINEYSIIMDAYVRHNGSIMEASKELFLHKNTLQYRLNKLNEITGYNPRNLNDMVVLYLAFIFFRLELVK